MTFGILLFMSTLSTKIQVFSMVPFGLAQSRLRLLLDRETKIFIFVLTIVIFISFLRKDFQINYFFNQVYALLLIIFFGCVFTIFLRQRIKIFHSELSLLFLCLVSHVFEGMSSVQHININFFDILFLIHVRRYRYLLLFIVVWVLIYLVSARSSSLIIPFLSLSLLILAQLSINLRFIYLVTVCVLWIVTANYLINTYGDSVLFQLESNLGIRLHMIAASLSNMNLIDYFVGSGFGTPYRDQGYSGFSHPLMNDRHAVMIVSNHNSLFDIFSRGGLLLFAVFLYLIKPRGFFNRLKLNQAIVYSLFFYSLIINAALDYSKYIMFSAICISYFRMIRGNYAIA